MTFQSAEPAKAEISTRTRRQPRGASIPKIDRAGALALSFDQQRLFFLSQLEPTSPAYLVPLVLHARGSLDVDALDRAWFEVCRRHEPLRTRFRLQGSEPALVIDPVPLAQLGRASATTLDSALDLVRKQLGTVINLGQEHPVRLSVIEIGEQDHLLVLVLHHIVCDDRSLGLVIDDLAHYYHAEVSGTPAELPELSVQYADYAAWQRSRLSGPALDRELVHWQTRLSGLQPLDLPTDRPRSPFRSWTGDRLPFSVPAELAEALRALARSHDATLFSALLTAFQVLLARLSGQRDFAIGSAVDRRNRLELRGMVGFFLNTLVLRTPWNGDPRFSQALQQNRTAVLDALDHQDVPIDQLVSAVDQQRDLSRTPLFQVMFDMMDATPVTSDLPGLLLRQLDVSNGVAKFDLTVQIGEVEGGGLSGAIEYSTELFDLSTVRRIADNYLRLLESIVAQPDARLSELDVLADDERQLLLTTWNDTELAREWSDVASAVSDNAMRRPDSVALTFQEGQLSYGDLDQQAGQLADRLAELGVGPETVVGVCFDRGPDLVAALLAVWYLGAAYVPIDPSHPADRIRFLLEDSGAAVVLTASSVSESVVAGYDGPVVVLDQERAELRQRSALKPVGVHPDGLAYVIYTSGTTGRPKGVMVTHRGLSNYLAWASETYAGESPLGTPLFASMAFDLVVPNLYVPLMTGRTVHLLPPKFEADELADLLMAAAPYSFVKLTPAHLELLAAHLTGDQAHRLTATVVPAGDAFSAALLDRWQRLSGSRVINEYGPTEITVGNSTFLVENALTTELTPIGRPIPNTTAYVLDSDLRPTPISAVGEVYVGGLGVARGYRGQPRMTAEKFVPDPFARAPGARLYRTGDLARVLPDGNLDFVGRVDHQMKIRGYRIEPAEIESALSTHPAIKEAFVLDLGGRLAAYLVADGESPSLQEIRGFLATRLPAYMVPASFVTLDAFPLTENGKVDRRALADLQVSTMAPSQEYVGPRTDLEARISDIWQRSLAVPRVGMFDNFFDLGGDSIRAVGLVGALRDTGLDVTVRDVFQERTVAQLAEFLAGSPAPARPITEVAPFELIAPADAERVPSGVVDAYPLSEVQAGMVFEMLSNPDAPYHNGTSYRVKDVRPFQLQALCDATNLVVARHEVLRTSIDLSSYSVPMQLVHGEAIMTIDAQDLRDLSPADQEQEIHDYMAEERRNLFDLSQPPLIRLYAHITSDDAWWISITECHPVIEGWGYHLMLMEILRAYHALVDGVSPEFEPLPALRFVDFIAAQQRSLNSEEDRAYWQDVVSSTEPLTLPSSWGGGQKETQPVYDIEVPFHDLRPALLNLASRARVALKSVLHAAHLKVMSMLTLEPSFSTGLVCDTRPEALGADRVLGMYLNTVPFQFRAGARTWQELVQQVFASEVKMWPHRRYPMPAMRSELSGGKRLHHLLFNYLDFNTVDSDLVNIDAGIDYSPNDFDLVIVAHRSGILRVSAKPETVSRPYGQLLAGMYRRVLEEMASDPDGDARENYLPPLEWDRVIRRDNNTDVEWPSALTHELFEDRVRQSPEAVAIIDTDGSTTSYAELNRRANQLARYLRSGGLAPEDFVGVCLDHSVWMFVAVLGVLKAGGAYVPIDASHPSDRLAFILADTGARTVLTTDNLRERLPAGSYRVVSLDRDADKFADLGTEDLEPITTPDNLVYAMYTSGSTGRPKGVMIDHRGLNNYLLWAIDGYGLGGEHGAPMLGSIAFDLSVPNFFLPLIGGRDVTLLEPDPSLGSLRDLLCTSQDFSLLKITPAHLDMLRATLPEDAKVSSVRTFVVGADEVKPETIVAWRRYAPDARIIDEYGPTETVVGCSTYIVGKDYDPTQPVPIGKPISNIRMYVLDHQLRPLPTGVVGELYIGGVGVARGYLNRPELTASSFLPDPYSPVPGARFYRTGDLARRLPDGNLDFLGRIDNQVKIRGYRIELGEIEARLLQHPGIRDACVSAAPDRRKEKRLVAYIVPRTDAPPAKELRQFLGEHLPDYMLPAVFMVLDALPLSSGGKVDRARLPEPKSRDADTQQNYVAPQTATELALAAIWSDVLGVDRVGVHSDFVELGGHSLAALRVAGRVHKELNARVPVTSVLQARTVRAQAQLVEGPEIASSALVPLSTSGAGKPLVLVHPAGGSVFCYTELARRLDRPVYGLVARGLSGQHEPASSVEELAEDYLRAIEPLGTDLVLGGWSMGGLVAYEMARLLHERSTTAVPLLLLDSSPPGTHSEDQDLAEVPFLVWLAHDWAQVTGHTLDLTEADLAQLEPAQYLSALTERLHSAGVIGHEIDAATVSTLAKVARANVRAASAYRPDPGYPGSITVLAAADEPGSRSDPSHGWQAFTTNEVRAIPIAGDHYTFLGSEDLVREAE